MVADLWQPSGVNLGDLQAIRAVILRAVKRSGSTLVRSSFQSTEDGGVDGFALLKESHISIHTWPALGYAAVDAFTCGDTDCQAAIDEVESAFRPASIEVTAIDRGRR